jgi:hypothetical protein
MFFKVALVDRLKNELALSNDAAAAAAVALDAERKKAAYYRRQLCEAGAQFAASPLVDVAD